jgi:uncharacterized protein (TIGR02172 family)
MTNASVMIKSVSEEKIIFSLQGRVDSSNSAQLEKELFDLRANNPNGNVIIDAEGLEYISSAGLRILLRMRKQEGELEMINVSRDVYDIFELTGFTDILTVTRAMRTIDVEGCEIIGTGCSGTVYRLDKDTIVKLYRPWISLEEIQKEREYAKIAFLNGIPTAISYDVVRSGDSYGLVFEMLRSDTLGQAYKKYPEQYDELTQKYVAFVKDFHQQRMPEDTFYSIQSLLHSRADSLNEWCTQEEIDLLHSLIDCMPESNSPVHGDLHPGNIMMQDGELMIIDMTEMTTGPAIYDIINVYRDIVAAPRLSPKSIEASMGLPAETIKKIGDDFFALYTGLDDPELLNEYYEKQELLYAFNVCLTVGIGPEKIRNNASKILDRQLRKTVIPNEATLRELLQNL